MADYQVKVNFSIERGQIRDGIFYPGNTKEDIIGRIGDAVIFTAPITKAQARTFFNNIATQLREAVVSDPRMRDIIT